MTAPAATAAECAVWQLTCNLAEVANGVVGDALGALAKAVGDAVGSVLTNLATVWVDVGTPNLTTSGNNPSDAVAFLQDSLWWYMAAAAVLSVMVGGARMAWTMRAEPGKDVLRSLMTLTAVSGAGLAVVALAVEAADRFAEWIIDRSTVGTNFGENLGALILAPLLTQPPGQGTTQPVLIVILLGLVALISSFVQIVLMIVRSGMLVILAGIFPLAASFTTTETGRTWFRRCCAWLIAFILYKPAAAIVYATAFRLAGADLFSGSDGSGVLDVLVGVTMMVLAILALPALMRFVTPAVAVMSGSGGGGAGMAAAAAIPTGAAFARSGRDGPSGTRGGQGPSGAPTSGGGPSSTTGGTGAAQVPAQSGSTGASAAAGAGTAGAGRAATAATGVGAAVAAGAVATQVAQKAATGAATRSTGEGS
ncbi:hypothetical protein [Aquipuribacter hungaricus]|uniref:TrbL/VirB6 plasmid conjugal transfer protein n=1 Tax=Aquipuribacter hungaricus TaxID=545624 RepID=A0ABV7WIL2_9MICO